MMSNCLSELAIEDGRKGTEKAPELDGPDMALGASLPNSITKVHAHREIKGAGGIAREIGA